jgi:hypothetical protein
MSIFCLILMLVGANFKSRWYETTSLSVAYRDARKVILFKIPIPPGCL